MSSLPQAYSKYELLFTPRLIPSLKDLRGEEWQTLVRTLADLPETHPDALAFAVMMIELDNCLNCEMDSYRAQRGCVSCARQTVTSFKGTDQQLLKQYEATKLDVRQHLEGEESFIQLSLI